MDQPATSTPPSLAAQYAAAAAAVAESQTAPPLSGDGSPISLAGEPGLARLIANLDGTVPPPPTWYLLGYRLVAAEHGRVQFELDPLPGHANYGGTLHGGVIAALADSAMACAVLSTLDVDVWCATIELKVNMLRPVPLERGRVHAVGKVRSSGRSVAVAEASLAVDGQDVAIGLSSHAIRSARRLPGGPEVIRAS